MDGLKRAIALAGGQTALARRIVEAARSRGDEQITCRQQDVHGWIRRGRVPDTRVLQIVSALEGRVTPHELRPDLYPTDGPVAISATTSPPAAATA